jgi:plasmid stabilization system protein ParE
MSFVFHPEARFEFLEATRYYTRKEEGLGLRFTSQIRDAVAKIIEAPRRWNILEGEVRRYLIKIFPYGVLYTAEIDHILIIAVMHCRREPGYWRHRLSP